MSLPESVHKLVNPWTLVLTPREVGTYRTQTFPPLLDMLDGLIHANTGKTRAGANDPSTRSVVDVSALDLRMHIADVSSAWLNTWGITLSGATLKETVAGFHIQLENERTHLRIAATEYGNLSRYPDTWARRIWELMDPPKRVPLKDSRCPVCRRYKALNEHGEIIDALVVTFSSSDEPVAYCVWEDCGATWTGASELVQLGVNVGASVNHDVLKDMGVQ